VRQPRRLWSSIDRASESDRRATLQSDKPPREASGKASVADGLCLVHAGKQNMGAIGKRGGQRSAASRNGLSDEVADQKLIGLGKRRLEQLVNSENEQVALRAATALYSYRAQQPPSEPASVEAGPVPAGRGVSLAKLIEIFVFDAKGALDDEFAAVILRSAAKVRDLQAAGVLSPTVVDAEHEAPAESDLDVERPETECTAIFPEADLAELDRWRAGASGVYAEDRFTPAGGRVGKRDPTARSAGDVAAADPDPDRVDASEWIRHAEGAEV
jgi:hypothetical protein